MAIGVWIEVPGGTQQQYDAIMKELNLGGKMPQGGLYHFAGPLNGNWCVCDVWESREAFDRFFNQKLQHAIQSAGLPHFQPKFFPIHNMLTERAKAMGR